MIQSILPALSIGDLDACKEITQRGWTSTWTVLHACKEPCHRAALGYTGRGADANHPEYLWAERGEHDLYVNLVDAPDPNFFSVFLLCRALDYLTQTHQAALASNGRTVLVHCNKGHSRSPGLVLLYILTRLSSRLPTYAAAKSLFVKDYYPGYEPGEGLDKHLEAHWREYQMAGFLKTVAASPILDMGPA